MALMLDIGGDERISTNCSEFSVPPQSFDMLIPSNITWLIRRISRMYPAEVPYRIWGVLRSLLQEMGFLLAKCDPVVDASCDRRSWLSVPAPDDELRTQVVASANDLIGAGINLFDIKIDVPKSGAAWNSCPKTGKPLPMNFGLGIDFRHLEGVDVKYVWELSRHVWIVPLAQAYAVGGGRLHGEQLLDVIESWIDGCPYPLGVHWASPVEHGIRLINWSIAWNIIGGIDSELLRSSRGQRFKEKFFRSVYQHLIFIKQNISLYSSADNHLIGELSGIFVALHTWDFWPELRPLRSSIKKQLEREILMQFAEDGVNREQAFCYHKFSLEFILAAEFCGLSNGDGLSSECLARVRRALEFICLLMDMNGRVPAVGDSDDGTVFNLSQYSNMGGYERIVEVGAVATGLRRDSSQQMLNGSAFPASASDWVHHAQMRHFDLESNCSGPFNLFREGGYFVARGTSPQYLLLMDVGQIGYNRISGHGHADALSLLWSCDGVDYLIDPGTYCYNAEPALREYFRGTRAHNTVSVDAEHQSIYGGSFLWLKDISVSIENYSSGAVRCGLTASHDGYMRMDDPVRHRRELKFDAQVLEFEVFDTFECKKSHIGELNWHISPDCSVESDGDLIRIFSNRGRLELLISGDGLSIEIVRDRREGDLLGSFSRKFYIREKINVINVRFQVGVGTLIRSAFKFFPDARNC